jgi:hypothetical protein
MLKAIRPIVKPFLRPFFASFQRSLQNPHESQQLVLKKIISKLATTEYGRALKIRAGDDYEAFTAKVPLVHYEDLNEWLERQKKTEDKVLLSEAVLFYEKTSGSSAAAKFIPYTRALKNSFNRMFLIWLYDLLESLPNLKTGKTFISISPAFNATQTTERGVRIGLDNDAEYLHRWVQILLKPFLLLPASIKRLQDPANFKRAVAAFLLAEKNLEVISIWNPSFLQVILDFIQANVELLTGDLRRGSLTCESLTFRFKRISDERMALLQENQISWQHLWPELKLISCWTSANAKQATRRLAVNFPDTLIQGKGLLATEAPMTLPFVAASGFVPMLTEVFFEFLDEQKNLKLLCDLETGREYEIILTQQGGLYRYRIGDRVRVTHFYRATPCLEFVGRSDAVCDLVGEKLDEQFVQDCLMKLSLQGDFQTLVPMMKEKPYYILLTDSLEFHSSSDTLAKISSLETVLDNHLCEAFHYRQARMLGQLDAVRICFVEEARPLYYDYFVRKGQKFGDIKPHALITNLADGERLFKEFNQAATKHIRQP